MSTDEFGKSWGTLSYERKVKLTTPTVKQPAQFMKMMETGFNFHPVQVIGKGENRFNSDLYMFFCTVGSEAIAAGSFLPNHSCLVHGKITSSSLEFWVRSSSSLLTESLAKHAPTVFN